MTWNNRIYNINFSYMNTLKTLVKGDSWGDLEHPLSYSKMKRQSLKKKLEKIKKY